jgi:hypothetical protein
MQASAFPTNGRTLPFVHGQVNYALNFAGLVGLPDLLAQSANCVPCFLSMQLSYCSAKPKNIDQNFTCKNLPAAYN